MHKIDLNEHGIIFCGDCFFEDFKKAITNISPQEIKNIIKQT